MPFDAAVWLSHTVSGGAALSSWLHDKLLLVGTLVLWYMHHSPPLACSHMTIPSLSSAPPLIPSLRPYFPLTYDPPGPDLAAVWAAGDVAGSIIYLLFELDTLSASACCSLDAQGAVFSAKVLDTGVGPAVGWSLERVLGAGDVYNG